MLKSIVNFIFTGRGEKRELEGKQRNFVALLSFIVILYHLVMLAGYCWGLDFWVFLWTHLGSVGILSLLLHSPLNIKERKISAESFILAIILLGIMVYWLINTKRFLEMALFASFPKTVDAWLGWVLILLIFEGARRSVGFFLPLLVGSLGFYTWIEAEVALNSMNKLLLFQGMEGVWGIPLRVSATVLVPLFSFAGIIQTSKATGFMMAVANRLFGRTKGGAAKMAVIGSAGYGMVSGGAPTNVAVTGVITIPAMLRSGFKPAVAGAFESVASAGGAITPPIMGTIVFIMATITEIPYAKIMLQILPVTLIFYLTLFLQSHWIAVKNNIGGIIVEENMSRSQMIRSGVTLIIPIIVLLTALIIKYSVQWSFLGAIITISSILIFLTLGRGWKQIVEGLIVGGYNSAYLVFVMALASIFMELLASSALDMDMVRFVNEIFRGRILPILLAGAFLALILGMAGSIIIAYVMAVGLIIPPLVMAGSEVLPAHLFAIYFGVMAYITPPICTACFVATRFVDESFWRIGWESIKLAVPLWVLPFVFVYRPELLLISNSPGKILLVIVFSGGGVIMLTAAIRGMLINRIKFGFRAGCLITSILLLMPNILLNLCGSILALGMLISEGIGLKLQRQKNRDSGSGPDRNKIL